MSSVPSLETFTRLGFAARGLLYLMVGYLAIEAGRTTGSAGALRSLADDPLGRAALVIIALGLFAYGAWRCADAVLDLEGAGGGAKGAIKRAGCALSGFVHLGLGFLALRLVLGASGGAASGGGEQAAAEQLFGLPGGELMARLLAVAFMLGGLAQAWSAYKLEFLKQLEPAAAGKAWVKWAGRVGYLARGVVFVLVGVLLWRAAAASDPQQAGGTGEALASLDGWSQLILAAGLMLFGVFSIVQAVYRRITDPHVLSRLKAKAG